MYQQEDDIEDINFMADQSRECSIIKNPNIPKPQRIALVRSMTDHLQLTLDDIKNPLNLERLNSLSIVPFDLVPFEIKLVDDKKSPLWRLIPW